MLQCIVLNLLLCSCVHQWEVQVVPLMAVQPVERVQDAPALNNRTAGVETINAPNPPGDSQPTSEGVIVQGSARTSRPLPSTLKSFSAGNSSWSNDTTISPRK
jgi:hypothetical protein